MPPTRKLPVALNLITDDTSPDGKTLRDWKAASAIALELMLRADLSGVWHMRPKDKVRQMSPRRFKVVHQKGHSLIVRIKPGDNDSVWEYALSPPGNTQLHQAQQSLYDAAEAEPAATNGQAEPEVSPHIGVHEMTPKEAVQYGGQRFDLLAMVNQLQAGAERAAIRRGEVDRLDARKAELNAKIDELRKEITRLDEAMLSILREDEEDIEGAAALKALNQLEILLAARAAGGGVNHAT